MKHQIPEKKIQEVANKIARNFKPEKIILFGSYAWGKPQADSDVDLFVIAATKNTRELTRKIDGSLSKRTFPLDIIVYRPESVERNLKAGDFFIRNIVNKGKILYDRQKHLLSAMA